MSSADEDTRLEDELCALQAIFGEDCEASLEDRVCTLFVPSRDAELRLQVRLFFPANYPGSQGPAIDLVAPHLSQNQQEVLQDELEDLFLPGEVLF